MHKVFLGLGGNIGNKHINFRKVRKIIEKRFGVIVLTSSIYETPPWGFKSENNFWNQIIVVETDLEPEEMLWRILEIEDQMGRKRGNERFSSRKMDIDILYYDDIYMETKRLIIPHPRIHQRKFVLVPLNEIAPDFKHPLFRLTSMQMLENCKDQSVIKKVEIAESDT